MSSWNILEERDGEPMAHQTIIREQKVKLGPWPPPTRSEWHAWVTDTLSQRLISRGTRGPQTEIQIIMKYYLQFYSAISTNDIGKMSHLHQIQNTNYLFTYPQPKVHSQYPTWLPQWLPHTQTPHWEGIRIYWWGNAKQTCHLLRHTLTDLTVSLAGLHRFLI